tara:strand:+ start:3508 stop:4647 length:1140 start_codon:yes stop_codon:yes gene_type:complete
MSKYNVGDRVTVNGDFAPDVPEGSIGTIEDTTYSGAEVRIDGDWGGDTWFYYDNELEPYVEPSASSKHVALIVNSSGATVVIGTDVHTIANDHPNFEAIKDAYADPSRHGELENLISVTKAINSMSESTNIRVENGKLFYGDREMKTGLARRIIQLVQGGKNGQAAPLVNFMENVMLNPSFRAVEGLYEWLEKSNLPITPDGCFIAWKMVRDDYKDHYSGTFDNSVGCVVEIPRNQVDENPDRTCSSGLHFCSNDYLGSYGGGGRTMMVKVNPRDVGAFPRDYNTSKGRCCRYEVIEEVTREEAKTRFTKTPTAVYSGGTQARKIVERLDTRGDRAEVTLVFTDGSTQLTKNRLGDTTSYEQKGDTVTLLPSGRTITIA